MAASETYLWICLALCVAMGGSDVLYKRSGEEVLLDCGNADQNDEFEWKHDNALVIKMPKTGRPTKGTGAVAAKARPSGIKLKIPSLMTEDSGIYSCTGVDENLKKTQKKIQKVTQKHTLHVMSVTASPSQTVMHSSDVTLSCEIPSDPTAKVQWMRPGGTVPYKSSDNIITLKSITVNEAGKWSCQINSNGKVEKVDVDINVLGPLTSTEEVTAHSGGSANLTCSVPDQSVPYITSGNWSHDSSNGLKLPTLVRDSKGLKWNREKALSRVEFSAGQLHTNFTVTVTKVKNTDKGRYVCSVTFQNGRTLSTALMLKVEGEEARGPLGVSMWIWITAAAAVVLIIGLVVVITLIHLRNKRMRRKVRKLKSMRQPLTARNYCQCNRSERQPNPGKRERPPPLPRYQYDVMD